MNADRVRLLEVQSRRVEVIGCTAYPDERSSSNACDRQPAKRGSCTKDGARCAKLPHLPSSGRPVSEEEWLDRIVPLGESHLRQRLQEFAMQYHRERNHQGLANELIDRPPGQ